MLANQGRIQASAGVYQDRLSIWGHVDNSVCQADSAGQSANSQKESALQQFTSGAAAAAAAGTCCDLRH